MRALPLRAPASVTVVVPCYNYGHHLEELARWTLDQPGLDVRLIVVDDASPDGSGEVAERLAATDDRITVLRHATNAGHIRTYNDGLATVDTDYVVLLSADDLVPPGALTRAVALMEEHPQVGLVYGHARSFTGDPPVPRTDVRGWSVWSGPEWLRLTARQGRCFVVSPEVVMRTEALHQVGLYDPRLPHSADLDLWLRTALYWEIGRVDGPDQALYRVHGGNMHLTTYAGWGTDLQERRRTFDIFFDEHAAGRPETALRPTVMRALASEALRRAYVVRRDRGEAAEAAALVDLAASVDPGVLDGPRGLAWRGLLDPRVPVPAAGVQRLLGRAAHHLRWRLERRRGH